MPIFVLAAIMVKLSAMIVMSAIIMRVVMATVTADAVSFVLATSGHRQTYGHNQ